MGIWKIVQHRTDVVWRMIWVLTFEELLILSTIDGTQPLAHAFLVPGAVKEVKSTILPTAFSSSIKAWWKGLLTGSNFVHHWALRIPTPLDSKMVHYASLVQQMSFDVGSWEHIVLWPVADWGPSPSTSCMESWKQGPPFGRTLSIAG